MKEINVDEIISDLKEDNMYMMDSVCNLMNNSKSESFILNELRCMVKDYESGKLEIKFLETFRWSFSHMTNLPNDFDYVDLICYYTYSNDCIEFLRDNRNKESDVIGLFNYYINMIKDDDSND